MSTTSTVGKPNDGEVLCRQSIVY